MWLALRVCVLLHSSLKTECQTVHLLLWCSLISENPQELKSSLKVNFFPVSKVVLCVSSTQGYGLHFSLGKAGVWTTPRLIEWYLKGIDTDRVMHEGRKTLIQSMLCQICLKLLSVLWQEKQQRQNADLCEAHSFSKKMYSVFLSCYYSLSRNCIFQLEQILAFRNSLIHKSLKDIVRTPLHLTPKHSLVLTVLLLCLHWDIEPHR